MKKPWSEKFRLAFTLQVSNTNSREPPSSIRTSASVLSAEEVPFAHQCKYVNVFPRIRLAVRNSSGWLVCARQVRPITFQVVPRISKWVPCTSRQTHNRTEGKRSIWSATISRHCHRLNLQVTPLISQYAPRLTNCRGT